MDCTGIAHGKVHYLSETETFGSGFTKRSVVLEADDGKYKNLYGFEFFKDKISLLDGIAVGDEITVHYNLARVREYEGRWYANMHHGWKVEAVKQGPKVTAHGLPAEIEPDEKNKAYSDENQADIPF